MKLVSGKLAVASILTAGACCISTAQAQTVDYGSLQSLFGESVTTSATGTPQRASDVPADMTIITADEIRQSGSRNIPAILSRVPGLDIFQESATSFDVGVRGYQQAFQPRLLVLIDGRQVFIDDYSRTIWDNLPVNIDDIRQIEVVKGASSALFGSNAAGGVINIITYSPIYDHNNVASVSMGTQVTLTGDATVTQSGNWGGTKFSAGGLTQEEFSTPRNASSDQIPSLEPRHRYAANSSVFQVTPDLQVNTEFTYSDNTDNTVDGISFVTAAQRNTTYSVRAGLTWQSDFGLITSNNYFNHDFTDFFEFPNLDAPYQLVTNMFVSQLQDQFKTDPDDTFRFAAEYRHKDFTGVISSALVAQNPDLRENDYAGSGTWLWQASDRLSWTNAARVDVQHLEQAGTLASGLSVPLSAFNHTNTEFSGNSELVYKATEEDTFHVGYGRGVQMPSLIQTGFNAIFNFDGAAEDSEGNPKLKPTIVEDYSLGYDRKIAPLDSTLKLSAFYEINRDIAALQFGNQVIHGGQLFITENVGNSHGYGSEIELKGSNAQGFRWDASYSLAKVFDTTTVATAIDYQGSAPESHFRLLLGYSTGPWEFDTNGQYVTGLNMLHSTDGGLTAGFTPVAGYSSLSGRIGYKIDDRFTLALSGTNLTQANTRESPYPAIERQAFLTLTGHF